VSFQGNGCHFPESFHLVNDKGNHGEVKPSGRRVEMKGQLDSVFESNMELELIEVDGDRMRFGILRHFLIPSNLIEKRGDFLRSENNENNLTVITVRNHTICLKWRQSQKWLFGTTASRSTHNQKGLKKD